VTALAVTVLALVAVHVVMRRLEDRGWLYYLGGGEAEPHVVATPTAPATAAPAADPPPPPGIDLARDRAREPRHAIDEGATAGEARAAMTVCAADLQEVYTYVTDAQGRLVGVVPLLELLRARSDEVVGSLMTDVFALKETATMAEARRAFVRSGLLALPVVDASERLVGVVDAHAVGAAGKIRRTRSLAKAEA